MAAVISSLSPSQGPSAGGHTVMINGTGFTGATLVRFRTTSASFSVLSATRIIAIAPAGTGSVAVTVTTASGTSNSAVYTYVTTPVITGLSPSQGPTAGGNVITIQGTGFTSATSVAFGLTPTSFNVVSATQITATAPTGTGSVPVTVTTASGTSNSVFYTYAVTPVITGLSPSQGPTAGGNVITIQGTGFTSATSVVFGVTPTSFNVVSATQITATVPAGPAAPVNVTVTTPAGTSNPMVYSYIAAPAVISLDPGMGPEAGGNTVTITGTDLTLATAVTFGTNEATNINVLSDSLITADAPGGTDTVTVTVTTPGGTSTPGTGNAYYTYVGIPAIDSLIPDEGPAHGGSNVAIFGSNLTHTDEVRFGGTVTLFAAVSDNLVVATSPAGEPGTVDVTVHTPGGDSNGVAYQYEA
ncbi:IPT/TIG domain-containing protein [Streptomyces capitiformicae]|uniref:IPT/TIG domain-containing protein n=1 Tax=Streptomyces capitiformicae TaxID=2014920 RepID=UPI001AD83C11|nr:IPT/TIG domain-containing protein [Streptomyces capitiformicae]